MEESAQVEKMLKAGRIVSFEGVNNYCTIMAEGTEGVSLNTPDERCTWQARMPASVGFIFLALPILASWGPFLVFLC